MLIVQLITTPYPDSSTHTHTHARLCSVQNTPPQHNPWPQSGQAPKTCTQNVYALINLPRCPITMKPKFVRRGVSGSAHYPSILMSGCLHEPGRCPAHSAHCLLPLHPQVLFYFFHQLNVSFLFSRLPRLQTPAPLSGLR